MKADFFILFIGFSLILSSCEFIDQFEKGNGQITTVSREVGDFSKVRVGGNFEVLLSGAGVVKLSGETERQELELTGAGSLRAFDLRSNICKVVVSGLGGAKVNVMNELDAKIEGLGDIEYYGNPGRIRSEVEGLGEIKQIENY